MKIDGDRDGCFVTCNTALAAYLRITGCKLLEVDHTSYPAVFIFEQSPETDKYEQVWQMRQATGNLGDYFESYRLCLRMTRVGKL